MYIRIIGILMLIAGIAGIYFVDTETFGFVFGALIGVGAVWTLFGKLRIKRAFD